MDSCPRSGRGPALRGNDMVGICENRRNLRIEKPLAVVGAGIGCLLLVVSCWLVFSAGLAVSA